MWASHARSRRLAGTHVCLMPFQETERVRSRFAFVLSIFEKEAKLAARAIECSIWCRSHQLDVPFARSAVVTKLRSGEHCAECRAGSFTDCGVLSFAGMRRPRRNGRSVARRAKASRASPRRAEAHQSGNE